MSKLDLKKVRKFQLPSFNRVFLRYLKPERWLMSIYPLDGDSVSSSCHKQAHCTVWFNALDKGKSGGFAIKPQSVTFSTAQSWSSLFQTSSRLFGFGLPDFTYTYSNLMPTQKTSVSLLRLKSSGHSLFLHIDVCIQIARYWPDSLHPLILPHSSIMLAAKASIFQHETG